MNETATRLGTELRTSAIVLKVHPFKESDLITHLLTPDLGRISAIARHARGSKKRFPASIDLFDRGTATISREKNGSLGLKNFTPVHSLTKVRTDLDKLSLVSLILEAFEFVVIEGDSSGAQELFELLDLSLNAVDEADSVNTSLRATCIAISKLVSVAGIYDGEQIAPSRNVLYAMLRAIEEFTGRKLKSREMVEDVVGRIGRVS